MTNFLTYFSRKVIMKIQLKTGNRIMKIFLIYSVKNHQTEWNHKVKNKKNIYLTSVLHIKCTSLRARWKKSKHFILVLFDSIPVLLNTTTPPPPLNFRKEKIHTILKRQDPPTSRKEINYHYLHALCATHHIACYQISDKRIQKMVSTSPTQFSTFL